jgi:GNAT superfamily N-acetyltransferase
MWVTARLRCGCIAGTAAANSPSSLDSYASEASCFIESVWVRKAVRRNGIGTRLVEWLIENQLEAGIRDFYLWVLDGNTPAASMYRKMGFTPTGRPSGFGIPEFQLHRRAAASPRGSAASAAARHADYIRHGISYYVE